MSVPSDWEDQFVAERIHDGLVDEGHETRRAAWAAFCALREAPFEQPTEASWRWVCNRARSYARSTMSTGERPPYV